jgi:hypothetical protein
MGSRTQLSKPSPNYLHLFSSTQNLTDRSLIFPLQEKEGQSCQRQNDSKNSRWQRGNDRARKRPEKPQNRHSKQDEISQSSARDFVISIHNEILSSMVSKVVQPLKDSMEICPVPTRMRHAAAPLKPHRYPRRNVAPGKSPRPISGIAHALKDCFKGS